MNDVLKQEEVKPEETQPVEAEAVKEEAAEAEVTTEDPVAEAVEEPAAEPVEDPAAEAVEEPAAEPVEEPAAEAKEEPAAEPVEEPAAEAKEEPAAEATEEPAAEASEEPVAEAKEEPVAAAEEAKKDAEPTETMADYEENFDDANPWNVVTRYMENKANLTVTIESVVNGGALTTVEGLRAFIPASRLSLSYVEDLEIFLTKEMEVRVIDVDQSNNRLVLSAREILREKENAERKAQASSIKIGTIMEGVVETLQNYGAFVKLENGLSGLVHVSQISGKRVKTPGEVLKVGDEIKVKIIGLKEGKISLSIKALEERVEREFTPKVEIPKSENIGTNLGDLFKNIEL